MAARARKKFLTSPNFVFSAGGRVLLRGLCAMGAASRKMRAFHHTVVAFAIIFLRIVWRARKRTETNQERENQEYLWQG
jgi:hypothetical protein